MPLRTFAITRVRYLDRRIMHLLQRGTRRAAEHPFGACWFRGTWRPRHVVLPILTTPAEVMMEPEDYDSLAAGYFTSLEEVREASHAFRDKGV